MTHAPSPAAQQGTAAIEFALLALPLFTLIALAFEATQWQSARQIANVALMQAARAGSTGHANPTVIDAAFERALTPLFVPPGAYDTAHARMRAAFARTRRLGLPPWRIDVLGPTAAAFARFGDPRLKVRGAQGRRAIHNDYQAERHRRQPTGRPTIFEANVLRLRLTYLHRPWLPWTRALVRAWGRSSANDGDRAMASAGLLPIRLDLAIEMQSHPVQWDSHPRGGLVD